MSGVKITQPIYIYIFFKDKSRNLFKFVSVLLSASVERVGVSCMRDFCIMNYQQYWPISTYPPLSVFVSWLPNHPSPLWSLTYFENPYVWLSQAFTQNDLWSFWLSKRHALLSSTAQGISNICHNSIVLFKVLSDWSHSVYECDSIKIGIIPQVSYYSEAICVQLFL